MFTLKEMPQMQSLSSLFSAYASFATTMMLIRSITTEIFPPQITSFLSTIFSYLLGFLSSSEIQTTLIIEENHGYITNQVFEAAETYLRTKISPSIDTLKVTKNPRRKKVTLSIDKGQEISDCFNGVQLNWRLVSTNVEGSGEKLHFELIFAKKFRDMVVDFYFPYILKRAVEIREEDEVVKLSSQYCPYDEEVGGRGDWGAIRLNHPATFDTLALDPKLKKSIIDDLDRFINRKEFYKKVGKAWKRGYLLYGPPGTGKSSLVAAMANYLKYDIYDLDISNICSNADLLRVLLTTSNRSILLIEDIDCSADILNRQDDENFDQSNSKFTLSGMLNFIDGLWSSCGDERIIIFTTNHKERLDPALLRPGRMDVHINMSYCCPEGLKVLVMNYLGNVGIEHRLYREIEELIGNVEVSPAEVAGELMKDDDVDKILEGLINFVKLKKEEQTKANEEKMSEINEEEEEEDDDEISEKDEKRKYVRRRRRLRLGGKSRGRKIKL